MDKLSPREKPINVKEVVIKCMDFRYHEVISQILMEEHDVNYDKTDQLTIGGSSKAIVDGTLMPSLKIAYEKHGARDIYVFDHIDCGGFGGQAAFDNNERKEADAHFESIDEAQAVLNKAFKDLVVVTYVIGLDGERVER